MAQHRYRLLVATTLMAIAIPSAANASTSATAGATKCTVTAVAPTLNGTTITATATVMCTVSTSISVEVGVVELDGTVEDVKVEIALIKKAVTVLANKASTITITGTCVSTETGNEELATKVRVNLSGIVSAFDRTVPKNDAFAC